MKKQTVIFLLGLLLPLYFAFHALFVPGPVAWGDAPYFYPEGLGELVNEPYVWVARGTSFGGINLFLWLSPIMLLYGILYKLFNLGNDVIIRLIFYFPSLLLSLVSPILLVRYLKYSKKVQFFASLVYFLNTYYFILVDGGVVGLLLAYGLYPICILLLKNLIDKPSFEKYILATVSLFVLTSIDPRVGVIAVATIVVWEFIKWIRDRGSSLQKSILRIILVSLTTLALSSYWLVPLAKLGGDALNLGISKLDFISLLDSILLYQPHWPLNEFGKLTHPPFYFVGVFILIFFGFLIKGSKNRKKELEMGAIFLLFAFMAKGGSYPAGGVYEWLTQHVPLGVAFRDSSKFFIPLTLFAGILIGISVDKVKNNYFLVLTYLYLLMLVLPAIKGDLGGVLAKRTVDADFSKIYSKLSSDKGFYRVAWFPEVNPFSYQDNDKEAVSAKDLVNLRIFARLNTGTHDRFNFINSQYYEDWLSLMGIKYLVFSGNPRSRQEDPEEQKSWESLLNLVADQDGFKRTDFNTTLPIYETKNIKSHVYAADKLIAVVGSDNIYDKLLEKDKDINLQDAPFVFFEDGKFDPKNFLEVAPNSVVLVYNGTTSKDLLMSFVSKHFIPAKEADVNEWAVYSNDQYLEWRYQLLVRGLSLDDFDYEKGIAFSTEKGEVMTFTIRIPESGDYQLSVRSVSQGEGLRVSFDNREYLINSQEPKLVWFTQSMRLSKGTYKLTAENMGGVAVFNTFAVVPQKDVADAEKSTEVLTTSFPVVSIDDLPATISKISDKSIEVIRVSPVAYNLNSKLNTPLWVVFTDSYNPSWKLRRGQGYFPDFPMYSTVNGFYLRPEWEETSIVFKGQEYFRWGAYWTAVSFLLLLLILTWHRSNKYVE